MTSADDEKLVIAAELHDYRKLAATEKLEVNTSHISQKV